MFASSESALLLSIVRGQRTASPPNHRLPTAAPVRSRRSAPEPPHVVNAKSWVLMDYASGRMLASKQSGRTRGAGIDHQGDDGLHGLGRIGRRQGAAWMTRFSSASTHGVPVAPAPTARRVSSRSTRKVPLKDLLYGMIIQSGNDAAIALAEHMAGSEKAFAQLMNAYAKRLGMTGTHYANATGYPVANHYTTARDMAMLSRALIHDFPTTTTSRRSKSSSGTASPSTTATPCCGVITASTASRPGIPRRPATAWPPRPSVAISA